ncbi:MAG: D-xylonate dehydratase [Candidatus Woesearchaeota archaeon]|nr:D-xylonate dehydratase [Candidatus Woesearchaeota archaeon]
MKIKKITSYPIKLQFKEPFKIANVVNYDMYYVIIKLITDNNIVGYGEAIPAWEVTGETQFSVIDTINHLCKPTKTGYSLIGKEIGTLDNIRKIHKDIISDQNLLPIWGAPSAKAALEAAMLDALGKHKNKQVCELFGGKNKNITVSSVIPVAPVKQTLKTVQEKINQNIKIIKIKIGIKNLHKPGYNRDIEVINKARKLINNQNQDILLVADANQGFITPETTIKFCHKIKNNLDWLEQPILADNKLGFKEIKKQCEIKLMADESVHSYFDAKLLLEMQAIDFINIKLMKTGGLISASQIVDLADKYGVTCQMGSMLEAELGTAHSAHAYLSNENYTIAEIGQCSRLKQGIGKGITLENNKLKISSQPGLGITLNQETIKNSFIKTIDSITYNQIINYGQGF